jgi:VWFA-related protein
MLFAGVEHYARGQVAQPPTFRISVDRIQVSAVVPDSKGRQVTDLGIDDFTVLDAGKRQQLTSCEYVPLAGPRPDAPAVSPAPSSGAPPRLREVKLLPEQVRRSIVFVLDDESFSADAIPAVRRAVKSAIERDLQPGDLAALIRTSSGNGSLEQFTADRRLLLESAGKIRWRPESRGNPGLLPQIDRHVIGEERGYSGRYLVAQSERRTESVLRFVFSALRDLPGRKAVFLISQSLPLWGVYANPTTSAATDVGAMVDEALRAGVVIYCTDPTPLSSLTPGADYDVMNDYFALHGTTGWGLPGGGPGGMSNQQAASMLREYTGRALLLLESYRSGLRALAEGTGGQMAADTDVGTALGRFANDLQGYYLLTYKPRDPERYFTPTAGDSTPFRSIKIRVVRAGMHVRSYAGYIATPSQTEPETSAYGAISKALFSPFSASGVRVTLTSIFTQPRPSSPEITLLLHVDAHDLTFTTAGDGRHNAAFEGGPSGRGGERTRPGGEQRRGLAAGGARLCGSDAGRCNLYGLHAGGQSRPFGSTRRGSGHR